MCASFTDEKLTLVLFATILEVAQGWKILWNSFHLEYFAELAEYFRVIPTGIVTLLGNP